MRSMILRTVVLLLGLGVPMAAWAQDPRLTRSWQLDDEADKRLAAGDEAAAELLVDEALLLCNTLGQQAVFCLVPARMRRGDLARARGDNIAAEAIYRADLALARIAYPPQSGWFATLLQKLAISLSSLDRLAEAEALLREAVPIAQAHPMQPPELPVSVLNWLAFVLQQEGRWMEAAQASQDAAGEMVAIGNTNSALSDLISFNRAIDLQNLQRDAEAELLLRSVLASRQLQLGARDPLVATTLVVLAGSLRHLDQVAEAESIVRQAIEIYQSERNQSTRDLADALNTLGIIMQDTGRPAQAAGSLRQALQLQQSLGPSGTRNTANMLETLATIEITLGQHQDAERLLRDSIAVHERFAHPANPDLLRVRIRLGLFLCDRGAFGEAAAIGVDVEKIADSARLSDQLAHALIVQGLAARLATQLNVALPLLERARAMMLAADPADPWLPNALRELARTRMALLDLPAAVQALAEEIAWYKHPGKAGLQALADALQEQANILLDLRRFADAEAIFQRAAETVRSADGSKLILAQAEIGGALAMLAQGRRAEGEVALAQGLARARVAEAETPWLVGPFYQRTAHRLAGLFLPVQAQDLADRAIVLAEAADDGGLTLLTARFERADIAMLNQDYATAHINYDRALTLNRTIYGDAHTATAWILHENATAFRLEGHWEEADDLARQALARFTAAGDQRGLASAADTLGLIAMERGHYAEAEALLGRARVAEQATLSAPSELRVNILGNLSALMRRQNRIAESVLFAEEAVKVAESVYGPDQAWTALPLNLLALAYSASTEPRRAEAPLRRALALLAPTLGENHARTAQMLANLGSILLEDGRIAEAEALLNRAVAAAGIALPPNHPDQAQYLLAMADLRAVQGREVEAEFLLRQAVELRLAVLGPDHPATAASQVALGDSIARSGRLAEAEAVYRAALGVQIAALGKNHAAIGFTLMRIGDIRLQLGRVAEASDFHQRAVAITEAALGSDSPALATTLQALAWQRAAQNQDSEAVRLGRRALVITEAAYGADSQPALVARTQLASLLMHLGTSQEAASLFQQSLVSALRRLPDDSLAIAELRLRYGQLLTWQGRFAPAEDMLKAANAVLRRAYGANNPRTADGVAALAAEALARNDNALALVLARRTLALREMGGSPDSPAVAQALRVLALSNLRNDQPGEAELALNRAGAILDANGDENTVARALLLLTEAALAEAQHDHAASDAKLSRYLDKIAEARPNDLGLRADGLNNLGLVRTAVGRTDEAVALFEEALATYETLHGHDHPAVATVLLNLAAAQQATGQMKEAEESRAEALAILRQMQWGDRMPERWL